MVNQKRVQFKATKDSAGGERCSIYVDGKNCGSASIRYNQSNGGKSLYVGRGKLDATNCDLRAVVLALFIKKRFFHDIKKLDGNRTRAIHFQALDKSFYKTWKDGRTPFIITDYGLDAVVEILEDLGYTLEYDKTNLASTWYILDKK